MTLEERFKILEETIETLEKSDISLEDSFKEYEKGMKIIKECADEIDDVEKKVMQLEKDGSLKEFE